MSNALAQQSFSIGKELTRKAATLENGRALAKHGGRPVGSCRLLLRLSQSTRSPRPRRNPAVAKELVETMLLQKMNITI